MTFSDDGKLIELATTVRKQIAMISCVERPPAGSLAAEDDGYLQPFGVLQQDLVHFRLRSAWDHLQAVEVLLSYSSTTTAPFAPYTIARAALVAAATAHWLVDGDADQRRWNAVVIHTRDVRRDVSFLETNRAELLRSLKPEQVRSFDEAIETRRSLLRVLDARLDDPQPGQIRSFDEKSVVAQAQIVFQNQDQPEPRLEVMYMRLSGVSHALPWASQRNRRKIADLPNGLERYVHEGDRAEILNCAAATARVATAAWEHYRDSSEVRIGPE